MKSNISQKINSNVRLLRKEIKKIEEDIYEHKSVNVFALFQEIRKVILNLEDIAKEAKNYTNTKRITSADIEKELKRIKKLSKEEQAKESREFLVGAGIVTKKGNLKKPYKAKKG
jgi:cyclopropane fatty-acyl-phospholipid synthase-like methyltransferase